MHLKRKSSSSLECRCLISFYRLDNLIMRYEEPSSMARWDSPLFTVSWDDPLPPLEQIHKVLTEGSLKPPKAGTVAVARTPTDALHTLEHTTMAMVSAIVSTQSASASVGGPTLISLSTKNCSLSVSLPSRVLTLSELQRAKRQFVIQNKKLVTLGSTEKGSVDWSEKSVADKFRDYLEENLAP